MYFSSHSTGDKAACPVDTPNLPFVNFSLVGVLIAPSSEVGVKLLLPPHDKDGFIGISLFPLSQCFAPSSVLSALAGLGDLS